MSTGWILEGRMAHARMLHVGQPALTITEEQVTAGLPHGAQGSEPSVEGHRLRQTMKAVGPWQFHSELVACGQAASSCLPAAAGCRHNKTSVHYLLPDLMAH